MKRTALRCSGFALICLVGLFWAAPVAHAQFKLAAQNIALNNTIITPPNPAVLATNDSPEIMALDVPSVRSSGYLQISATAIWEVDATAATPVTADFTLRFKITSPALPPGIVMHFSAVMTNFQHSNSGAFDIEGGTAQDIEVLPRKTFADFLLAENPTLTAADAAHIADGLFEQGFHVSVSARLVSMNAGDGVVVNPNVAFFQQARSREQREQ